MIKKTVTFEDFNEETQTEAFYFHLNKADVIRLEAELEGIRETLEELIKTKDGKRIVEIVELIILRSYGVRSDDGARFFKSQEQTDEFKGSEAYSELLFELVTDADKASEFINGLLPEKLLKQAKEAQQNENTPKLEAPEPKASGMSEDDLKKAFEEFKAQQKYSDK